MSRHKPHDRRSAKLLAAFLRLPFVVRFVLAVVIVAGLVVVQHVVVGS
jgi:hypothetical protein